MWCQVLEQIGNIFCCSKGTINVNISNMVNVVFVVYWASERLAFACCFPVRCSFIQVG